MQNESSKPQNLIGLLLTLLLFIVAGVGGGYFYADMQPKRWKASAVFELPQAADLGNYFALYHTYTLVQQDGKIDPNLEKQVSEDSYAEFQRVLLALDSRRQFLSENVIVKQIADVHYLPLNEVVNKLSDALHFDPNTRTLSLALVNPEQAGKLLTQFIVFTREQVRTSLNNELIAKWKFLFQNVKQSAEANLGEGWQAKLNLMRSVQPLDNQLTPYRLVQKPTAHTQPEPAENLLVSLGVGAGIGFLLGLFFILNRRK